MKRLTEKHFKILDGYYMKCSECCEETMACNECKEFEDIVDRLGVIENILGDDYDLDRLRELVEADRDGRCKIFPFDIGDVVYTNLSVQGDRTRKSDRPYAVKVVYIGIGDGKSYFHVEYPTGRCFPFDMDQIGKIVFLTREEAEAALQGENHG